MYMAKVSDGMGFPFELYHLLVMGPLSRWLLHVKIGCICVKFY
jgi:hypothetical protein